MKASSDFLIAHTSGQLGFDMANSVITDLLDIPCTASTITPPSCQDTVYEKQTEDAQAAAKAKGHNLEKFDIVMTDLPFADCDFAGLGYVGKRIS